MQVINPENLDPTRNLTHQLTRELDMYLKLGQLTRDEASAIFYEWFVPDAFNQELGDEIEAWVND